MNIKSTYFLLSCILFLVISSCKERNEQYPLVPWSDYFFEKENISSRPISSMLIIDEHTEWYGSLNSKGILYNNGYEWQTFGESNTAIPFDSVTAMVRDGNGIIWVSWKKGLASFNGVDWEKYNEFTGKRVTALSVQGTGIVWAGIDGDQQTGGIAKFSNGKWKFYTTGNSAIQSSHITAIAVDHDQQLWIGTSDKGLLRYNGDDWTVYNLDISETEAGKINCITVDPSGIIWVGTQNSQLIKFCNSDVVFYSTGTPCPVTSITVTPESKVFLGTAGAGVITMLNGTWTSYTSQNVRLTSDTVLTIATHPDGRVLASLSDGHIISFK